MSPDHFEHLLSLVGPVITQQNTHMRESISTKQRLVITVRFLSSGDAFVELWPSGYSIALVSKKFRIRALARTSVLR